MKKLFLIMILILSLPFSANAELLSQNQAERIAQTTLQQMLSDAEMSRYVLAESALLTRNNQDVWSIIYFGGITDEYYDTNVYNFVIDANSGEILELITPTLRHPVEKAFSDLVDQYGAFFTWTLSQKAGYSAILRNDLTTFNNELHEENFAQCPGYLQYLLSMDFRMPSEHHMPQETAREKANEALKSTEKLADYQLQHYDVFSSFLLNENNVYVWKFMYVSNDRTIINNDRGYQVQLNAETGEILSVRHRFSSAEDKYASYYE